MTPHGATRDRWGIPHVVGGSAPEVARQQGLVTALDRTWQLEIGRRETTGTTAEILGETGLAWDLFARRFGIDGLARRAYAGLADESRAFVDAYVDGVNAGLAASPPVPELTALGIQPQPWHPWTPLARFAALHVLFASFPAKLRRRHLRRTLGEELAALLHIEGLWQPGSNSWVVGGARTASGLPMVGGDPHRVFESPNVYQQVRLTCTDPEDPFDVAGFTFPGVPGVQHFAHAGQVAWGITNAMADYQDLYEERLERDGDEVRALGPDGWSTIDRHVETVEVRDADPVEVEVLVTSRGPVVLGGPGEEAFSLRTASWVLGDVGLDSLLPLLRARTAADVEAALAGWVEPVNNLVVADAGGDVRQRVVGRVPARAEENRWVPVPAWESGHAWTGWVDLPGRRVAPDEHLVTANHRMDASFERIGVEFAPADRADRIDALLAGRDGLTLDDFAAIHNDTLAGQAAVLLDALGPLDGLTPEGSSLQAELAAWDRRLDEHSTVATAYVGVREVFVLRLAADPVLAAAEGCPYGPLVAPWFSVPGQLYLSLANLLSPRGRQLVPDLEEHLRAAVETVAVAPRGEWGARHRYQPLHVLGHRLSEEPGLAGDNDCVRCTGAAPGSDIAFRGSVARYVWDLAGLDQSGWVVPLGADGDPAGPHHHDQLPLWVAGELAPVVE